MVTTDKRQNSIGRSLHFLTQNVLTFLVVLQIFLRRHRFDELTILMESRCAAMSALSLFVQWNSVDRHSAAKALRLLPKMQTNSRMAGIREKKIGCCRN